MNEVQFMTVSRFGHFLMGTAVGVGTLGINVWAQVPRPKHESRLHHLFASHRDTDNLASRFDQLKCALVLIQAGARLGTGFYISADGDVATASHVLADRTFSRNPNGTIQVNLSVPNILQLTTSKGERLEISATTIEVNPDAWLADVARLRTGTRPGCWLREVDDRTSVPGEHLITLGFPGLSFQTLTLYTGIMSARLTTNLPTVILNTGEAVPPSNEFIRVQMPISAGLSGAPVIDDDNQVMAIVTNAGGWTQDLDRLELAFRSGVFQNPPLPPAAQQPPNTITFTLNGMALTAELAGLFHDYASPGYGDAVPLRYLRKPPQQNPTSASRSH
jgi:S1-C subfamily serine protease